MTAFTADISGRRDNEQNANELRNDQTEQERNDAKAMYDHICLEQQNGPVRAAGIGYRAGLTPRRSAKALTWLLSNGVVTINFHNRRIFLKAAELRGVGK